jgi:hypothetical protein
VLSSTCTKEKQLLLFESRYLHLLIKRVYKMSSERASLKAAYFLDPKNLTYYFYLQVVSETWPPGALLVPFLPWKKELVVRARKPV